MPNLVQELGFPSVHMTHYANDRRLKWVCRYSLFDLILEGEFLFFDVPWLLRWANYYIFFLSVSFCVVFPIFV